MARRCSRTAVVRGVIALPFPCTRSKDVLVAGFRRGERVRRRSEYLHVQHHAERVHTRHFVFLVAAPAAPTNAARLGLIVTKKMGGAVARNRIKRLCREAFRRRVLAFPPGVDVVIVGRGGAFALSLDQVLAEWQAARAGLYNAVRKAFATSRPAPHISHDLAP